MTTTRTLAATIRRDLAKDLAKDWFAQPRADILAGIVVAHPPGA